VKVSHALFNLGTTPRWKVSFKYGHFTPVTTATDIQMMECWAAGPYLRTGQRGPGPGPGHHILKNRDGSMVCGGKKGCPRERNLREIYTENTIMFCLLSVFCVVSAYT
jgi:hypothetical protein